MRVPCPFYGFRWPERKTELVETGGNECGLDFDANGPCKMEQDGRTVHFEYCDVALGAASFISAMSAQICFHCAGEKQPVLWVEWRDRVLRRKSL